MKRTKTRNRRQYPRVARVNELLREIIAEELDRIDEDDLVMVTVTGVDCDTDLKRAAVYFDGPRGSEGDAEVAASLEAVRHLLQRAIGAQTRLKHTPELRFVPDPGVRAGQRIDDVLRSTATPGSSDEPTDG